MEKQSTVTFTSEELSLLRCALLGYQQLCNDLLNINQDPQPVRELVIDTQREIELADRLYRRLKGGEAR